MDVGIVYKWDKPSVMNLAWNLVGAAGMFTWAGVVSILMFGALKLACKLRIPSEIERKGIDMMHHGEPAYPFSAYGDGWGGCFKQLNNNPAKTASINPTKGKEIDNDGYQDDDQVDHQEAGIGHDASLNIGTLIRQLGKETNVTPVLVPKGTLRRENGVPVCVNPGYPPSDNGFTTVPTTSPPYNMFMTDSSKQRKPDAASGRSIAISSTGDQFLSLSSAGGSRAQSLEGDQSGDDEGPMDYEDAQAPKDDGAWVIYVEGFDPSTLKV